MLLAHFWSYLTKNATYGIDRGVSLDSDMALQVEMSEDWDLGKRLPQLGKGSSSVKS